MPFLQNRIRLRGSSPPRLHDPKQTFFLAPREEASPWRSWSLGGVPDQSANGNPGCSLLHSARISSRSRRDRAGTKAMPPSQRKLHKDGRRRAEGERCKRRCPPASASRSGLSGRRTIKGIGCPFCRTRSVDPKQTFFLAPRAEASPWRSWSLGGVPDQSANGTIKGIGRPRSARKRAAPAPSGRVPDNTGARIRLTVRPGCGASLS